MVGKRVVRGVAMIAVVAFLFAAGDRALAVKEPVTIPSTVWSVLGNFKLAGAGGSLQEVLPGLVGFGPVDDLEGDEFGMIVDPDGIEILVRGTYAELKPGKPVIVVDQADLEPQLEALLTGLVGVPVDVTMRQTTAKVSPKNKKGISTIRAFLNSKFQACIDDGGRLDCRNFTLQYKAVGGLADL